MKKYKEFLIKLKIYKESPISAQKVLSLWIIFKNPNSLWMTLDCIAKKAFIISYPKLHLQHFY